MFEINLNYLGLATCLKLRLLATMKQTLFVPRIKKCLSK